MKILLIGNFLHFFLYFCFQDLREFKFYVWYLNWCIISNIYKHETMLHPTYWDQLKKYSIFRVVSFNVLGEQSKLVPKDLDQISKYKLPLNNQRLLPCEHRYFPSLYFRAHKRNLWRRCLFERLDSEQKKKLRNLIGFRMLYPHF